MPWQDLSPCGTSHNLGRPYSCREIELADVVVGNVDVAVIEFERVPVGFEETRFAQDVGLLVIRMIPEPT